jgi:hypothetical protein
MGYMIDDDGLTKHLATLIGTFYLELMQHLITITRYYKFILTSCRQRKLQPTLSGIPCPKQLKLGQQTSYAVIIHEKLPGHLRPIPPSITELPSHYHLLIRLRPSNEYVIMHSPHLKQESNIWWLLSVGHVQDSENASRQTRKASPS